jgi:hypothetical protein
MAGLLVNIAVRGFVIPSMNSATGVYCIYQFFLKQIWWFDIDNLHFNDESRVFRYLRNCQYSYIHQSGWG